MTSVSVALTNGYAALDEPLLERAEVLDHAVVNQGHDAVAADVRMGVDVGRGAVRGPARVADADAARRGLRLRSSSARSSMRPAVLVTCNSPSSIVTTPRCRSRGTPGAAGRREELRRLLAADVSDDSAHARFCE